jgi:hypothetical protein
LNVPLSVRTESVTGRPADRVTVYRADGVVMITRRTTSPESGACESNASCCPRASRAPSANASDTQSTRESLPEVWLRITSLAARQDAGLRSGNSTNDGRWGSRHAVHAGVPCAGNALEQARVRARQARGSGFGVVPQYGSRQRALQSLDGGSNQTVVGLNSGWPVEPGALDRAHGHRADRSEKTQCDKIGGDLEAQ